jgi:lysyl-tRNA synthetase class 2
MKTHNGLSGAWQRLIGAVPTTFFWYVRLSGIVSILTWMSSELIEEIEGVWLLHWINYLGWSASLPYGLFLVLLSMGVRRLIYG